jgi:F420-non-reducing hydrogenase iron-sulfur subunit
MSSWKPRIVLFQCSWCLFSDEDQKWVAEQLPGNIQRIEVPCTGRISPLYVLNAVQGGADGVLISGCLPAKCHYKVGNMGARRQLDEFSRLLTFIGYDPRRIHFAFLDLQEKGRIQRELTLMEERLAGLGPSKALATRGVLREGEMA